MTRLRRRWRWLRAASSGRGSPPLVRKVVSERRSVDRFHILTRRPRAESGGHRSRWPPRLDVIDSSHTHHTEASRPRTRRARRGFLRSGPREISTALQRDAPAVRRLDGRQGMGSLLHQGTENRARLPPATCQEALAFDADKFDTRLSGPPQLFALPFKRYRPARLL